MYRYNELTGKRIGRLTVERAVGRAKDRHILWLCKCDCGNEVTVASNSLKGEHTLSCGCLQREATSMSHIKHGGVLDHSNIDRLYMVWAEIGQRCNNPKNKSFKYYGAKGVTRCKEWDDYGAFREWAHSNGYDPYAKFGDCTIDRVDPQGNYEPSNCRWVTIAEQNRNKRVKTGEVEDDSNN